MRRPGRSPARDEENPCVDGSLGSDTGDSLIEVLLAVVILSLTAVAMLAGFSTAIFGSAEHRGLATMDTVLTSAAQEVTAQMQTSASSSTDSAFVCPTQFTNANMSWNLQGATATIAPSGHPTLYWNGATPSPTVQPSPSYVMGCIPSAPQQVTVGVTFKGATSYTSIVVDDPLAPQPAAPGTATQLVFTTEPGNGISGSPFSTQPVVAVENAAGTVVWNALVPVNLSITGGSGAILSNCTGSEFYGAITFSGCSMTTAGTYQLTATSSDGTLISQPSAPFTISSSAASQLVFTSAPTSAGVGTPFSVQPVVEIEDASGNAVLNNTTPITLAIGTNPSVGGLGALTCTSNPMSSTGNGLISFAGCAINKIGNGYTLTASSADGSLVATATTPFNVAAGPPTQLAFSAQPTGGSDGVAFSTQPQVTVEDADGNPVTGNTDTITLGIGTNPGNGSLSCTSTTATVNSATGIASFSGCSISNLGAGYTLTATDGSLAPATTSPFTVTIGPAAQLAFTTSPSNSTGGVAFGTQPQVTVEDSGGNPVTGNTSSVSLAVSTGSGTVTCGPASATVSSSTGIASFAGCAVNQAGTGDRLTATDGSLTSATSSTFAITVGPAAQLAFTTSPNGGTGGVNWTTQPKVTVEDAGGNAVTGNSSKVTLAITSGSGTSGASLGCTANQVTVSSSTGIATFAGCDIDKAGSGYTLTATDGTLSSVTTGTFAITVGPAAQLAFTTSPNGGTGGVNWTTQPKVTVEDAGGNAVTGTTSKVTVAITTGTGTNGATLGCNANQVTDSSSTGIATFAGCDIDKAGSGYTLTATDGTLSSTASSSFAITVGPAAQLAFTTSPNGGTGGVNWTTQPKVTVEDAGGNAVTGTTSKVTVAITTGTGTNGATLGCNANQVTDSSSTGIATFAGCDIDKAGSGYTLTATDGTLSSTASSSFAITVGPPTQLNFTSATPSGSHNSSLGTQTVAIEDAGGNLVTSNNSSNITLSITSGSATLTCTSAKTLQASAGTVSFTGCKISAAGTYSLTATTTTTGIASDTTSTFTLT